MANMINFLKFFIALLSVSFFQTCDIPISDRVAIEEVCPRRFYKMLLLLSLAEQSPKNKTNTSNVALNPPLLAYASYISCLDRHPFGGTLITPLDDLLWNGCGRCYK